jgi:hypothetical protein
MSGNVDNFYGRIIEEFLVRSVGHYGAKSKSAAPISTCSRIQFRDLGSMEGRCEMVASDSPSTEDAKSNWFIHLSHPFVSKDGKRSEVARKLESLESQLVGPQQLKKAARLGQS